MAKHQNNSACLKCRDILDLYPGLHPELRKWFIDFQFQFPEAHVSCAGRGEAEQMRCYATGVSNAKWGKSPHNYNLAIDVFRIMPDGKGDWSPHWYKLIMVPDLPDTFRWGGTFKPRRDMPHVEVANWEQLVADKTYNLVESAQVRP